MSDERLEIVLKWSFGFSLVVLYSWLTHTIAVGKVEESTSYGLPIILNSLTGLGGAWGGLIVAGHRVRKADGNGNEHTGKTDPRS